MDQYSVPAVLTPARRIRQALKHTVLRVFPKKAEIRNPYARRGIPALHGLARIDHVPPRPSTGLRFDPPHRSGGGHHVLRLRGQSPAHPRDVPRILPLRAFRLLIG